MIDQSEHRDYIRRRLAGKTRKDSYRSISEELERDFGLVVSPSTLKWYRSKHIRPQQLLPPQACLEELREREAVLDTAAERARAISLQWERIREMTERESAAGKSNPSIGQEIRVYNELLTSYRKDLLELGIVEKAPERQHVRVEGVIGAVQLARERSVEGRRGGLEGGDGDVVEGRCEVLEAGDG